MSDSMITLVWGGGGILVGLMLVLVVFFLSQIRFDPVVMWSGAGVFCVVMGLFGAANWNCHANPDQPRDSVFVNGTPVPIPNSERAWEVYYQEVQQRRASAMVPYVVAVPLCFGGFVAGVVCFVFAIERYNRV